MLSPNVLPALMLPSHSSMPELKHVIRGPLSSAWLSATSLPEGNKLEGRPKENLAMCI